MQKGFIVCSFNSDSRVSLCGGSFFRYNFTLDPCFDCQEDQLHERKNCLIIHSNANAAYTYLSTVVETRLESAALN